ncbi:hypothetical protein GCM10022422_43510 [Flavobacterium ginsengisoli]|uniref:Uncharacterized protein n=1 Tax=Flavobacterium ginsengisoli TaxID=871694 RepID=A0ABP7G2I3_9FLAO
MIKSIVQSPIWAITPKVVNAEATLLIFVFGNASLNDNKKQAPIKLNQCAKSTDWLKLGKRPEKNK